MPSVPIDSNVNASGKLDKAEAMHGGEMKYVPAHERKNGPWDDYELEDMGRHVEMADKVKSNPKLMAAMAEHHRKKSKKHADMAKMMRPAMARGLISETQATKASMKNLEADRSSNHG